MTASQARPSLFKLSPRYLMDVIALFDSLRLFDEAAHCQALSADNTIDDPILDVPVDEDRIGKGVVFTCIVA